LEYYLFIGGDFGIAAPTAAQTKDMPIWADKLSGCRYAHTTTIGLGDLKPKTKSAKSRTKSENHQGFRKTDPAAKLIH